VRVDCSARSPPPCVARVRTRPWRALARSAVPSQTIPPHSHPSQPSSRPTYSKIMGRNLREAKGLALKRARAPAARPRAASSAVPNWDRRLGLSPAGDDAADAQATRRAGKARPDGWAGVGMDAGRRGTGGSWSGAAPTPAAGRGDGRREWSGARAATAGPAGEDELTPTAPRPALGMPGGRTGCPRARPGRGGARPGLGALRTIGRASAAALTPRAGAIACAVWVNTPSWVVRRHARTPEPTS
jgi:hypothetical protein